MSSVRRLAQSVWYLPEPVEPVAVHGAAPPFAGESLTVLSWNVQFAAGRNRCFFYDGGADVSVTRAEVESTLAGIAALIRSHDPDLVLLQEVDRGSARTHRIDQHAWLQAALGLPVHASTPYFWVPFVPVPPHDPLGRVEMHLSVFSRYALEPGSRFALSPLDEPVYRRIFNLRRALMQLSMPRVGAPALQLFQTHLSAFSRGDGTLDRQVRTVVERVAASEGPALLAGDFNSLPPGDDPGRLGLAAILYEEAESPIRPLYEALDVCFPSGPGDHTYVPFGSNRADRTIDYVFGRQLDSTGARVLPEGAAWSDHLPVRLAVAPR